MGDVRIERGNIQGHQLGVVGEAGTCSLRNLLRKSFVSRIHNLLRKSFVPEPHYIEDDGKQMDQESEVRIPSGNEPQSRQPLNLLPSEDLQILQIS